MTHSVGDRGSFRPQAGSIPTEPELNWRAVYPGQWRHEHGYIWADSIKGGNSTPAQVRGWGYLTGHGVGALALTEETATRIQNQVGAMIASAPALLEAAKLAEDIIDDFIGHLSPDEQVASADDPKAAAALKALRAAIQSATGEG